MLDNFAWRRMIRMLRTRHLWRWKDIRRQFTTPDGKWLPIRSAQSHKPSSLDQAARWAAIFAARTQPVLTYQVFDVL